MTDLILPLLSVGIALVLVLQIILLLRKTRIDLPSELALKLEALEQSARATLQAVAKNEAIARLYPGHGVKPGVCPPRDG